MIQKGWALTLGMVLCLITAGSTGLSAQEKFVKTITFSRSDVKVIQDRGFDVIRLITRQGTQIVDVGKPQIPFRDLCFIIPEHMKISSFQAVQFETDTLSGDFNVFPIQPPTWDKPKPWVPPDSEVYHSATPFPQTRIELLESGYMKEAHIIKLRLYPLQWTPSTKKLVLSKRMSFTLTLTSDTEGPLRAERRSRRSQFEFEQYLCRYLDNPEDIGKYLTRPPKLDEGPTLGQEKQKKGQVIHPVITSLPSLEGLGPEYVIITNQACSTAFQVLADWKMEKGLPTVIRTTRWIGDHYAGCDLQEKIRNFIKDAYVFWGTDYIVLGGDNDSVPGRIANSGEKSVSDLYYAGLDGNWNANGNKDFGEYDYGNPDNVDIVADVWVGRLPVHNPNEVNVVVDKIIRYEHAESSLLAHFKKTLLVAVWTPGAFDYIAQLHGIPAEWGQTPNMWKLYYPGEGGNEDLNRISFRNNLGLGYHLINHHDHCSAYLMGAGDANPSYGCITRGDIEGQTYPSDCEIMFTSGCNPAYYPYGCIGERFVLKPNGAGVAFVGYSTHGQLWEEWDTNVPFHEGLFSNQWPPVNQINRLGRLVEYTRSGLPNNIYGRIFGMTLLGDPDLGIWTDNPQDLVVQHPSMIPMGAQAFDVTVTYGGNPVDSALVCLEKKNANNQIEAYAYMYTVGGVASFWYTPETSGDIKITVTGRKSDMHNFKPHVSYCNVNQLAVQPYVFPALQGRIYTDPPPGGNNDGIPNSGENLTFTVALTNSGNADAIGVHAELYTPDMFLVINPAGANYGNIPVGATVTNTIPYGLAVAQYCPDVHDVPVQLTITAQGGYQWGDKFILTVLADSLKFVGHRRVPSPAAYQDITLDSLTVWNRGSGAASGVIGTLTCQESEVTIVQGTANFGDIPAGNMVTSSGNFRYTIGATPPADLHFTLTLQDGRGRTWVKYFGKGISLQPTGLSVVCAQTTADISWTAAGPLATIAGYHVYRSNAAGGPYVQLNAKMVTDASYYHDIGLNPDQDYYYKVAAVDTSMNTSIQTNYFVKHTNYGSSTGWPQWVGMDGVIWGAPEVGRLSSAIGLTKDVVVAGADGKIYAWTSTGQSFGNWPQAFEQGTACETPALADIDGDHMDEVIFGSGSKLYVWESDGTPKQPYSPISLLPGDFAYSSPTLADIDRDGGYEILLGTNNRLYCFHATNGGLVWTWDVPSPGGPICAAPSVGDLNLDGYPEIVVTTWNARVYVVDHNGIELFERNMCVGNETNGCRQSAALGDINGDGWLEIVVGRLTDPSQPSFYAWSHDGTLLTGWPVSNWLPRGAWGSPALGDVNGDGRPELVTGTVGCYEPLEHWYLTAFTYQGTNGGLVWQREMPLECCHSSPAIGGAIDAQGYRGVVIGSDSVTLWGKKASDGSDAQYWPQYISGTSYSSPTLCDLDGNGRTDVLYATQDGYIYLWNLPSTYEVPKLEWRVINHDARHSGLYAQPVSGTLLPNTVWGGNIVITGNVTIDAGKTLTIEPGTVIKFRPTFSAPYKLIVNGTLNAYGTALDSIYFTSEAVNPIGNDWTGIDVMSGGTANLQFCALRYGYNNLTAESGSNVTVRYCRITRAAAAGVVLRNGTHSVKNCDISDNSLYGLNIWGPWGGSATVQDNTISNNLKYGIYAHYNINSGSLKIYSNTISYPSLPPNPSLSGIKCDSLTNVVKLYGNNINGYGQAGISFLRSSAKCTCNVITNINNNGLYFYAGSSVVTHNTVSNVNIGAYVTPSGNNYVPNMGNGSAGSNGQNNITATTSWRGYNNSNPTVQARYNYWGWPFNPGWFTTKWNYANYLSNPPASCGPPPGGGPQEGELLEQLLPRIFALGQSYPNPSTGEMAIRYQLPKECRVALKVYNVSGQLVKALVNESQKAGYYGVSWDGQDENDHVVRSGVYFYKMEAGDFRAIRKLIIVR